MRLYKQIFTTISHSFYAITHPSLNLKLFTQVWLIIFIHSCVCDYLLRFNFDVELKIHHFSKWRNIYEIVHTSLSSYHVGGVTLSCTNRLIWIDVLWVLHYVLFRCCRCRPQTALILAAIRAITNSTTIFVTSDTAARHQFINYTVAVNSAASFYYFLLTRFNSLRPGYVYRHQWTVSLRVQLTFRHL